jgi:hypothetical protein
VKNLLAVLIALSPAVVAAAPYPLAPNAQIPHPAVVRVIAAEPDGVSSRGTGVLVAVDQSHGLVVTNRHVVRDATGPITVVFTDGFRSDALVLKTDNDWDLAALAIQRPRANPLPMATEVPRPGEPLAIAGYGPDGVYRLVAGRCVTYHSPGGNLPREIVEVDVEARRGDSGGPIYNARGEVAGILFGAGGNLFSGGYTMGSYCGRVRLFLAAAYVDFQRLPGNPTMVAGAPLPLPPPPTMASPTTLPASAGNYTAAANNPPQEVVSQTSTSATESAPGNTPLRPIAQTGRMGESQVAGGKIDSNRPNSPAFVPSPANSPVAQVSSAALVPQVEPLPSRFEQIKTVLAVIGLVLLLFHALRFLGSSLG